MKSKYYDRIKHWYEQGLWTAEQVHQAYEKGLITKAEYQEIVK